ncbi:MAG TPA: hypothetical protein VER55_12580, partial [Ardenticatenaceae bacterium]|nr:hypothetical protein [Ardenticatenaceae bacterium]
MHPLRTLIALWLSILPLLALDVPSIAAQGLADYSIPGGHFYTQTVGSRGGFSVIDDQEARFWSEFQRLGGVETVGYPISRRFVHDGFVTQAFQKLVLQWRPEVSQAWAVNVFDELSRAGHDDLLRAMRQTPAPLQNFDRPGATWTEVVRNRQALLDANPAIRERYFATRSPLDVFGLPTSRVEDMGNHYAIRLQRAVFQQWKQDVPWARAGQVTIANGGDIAREFGWIPDAALEPEAGTAAAAIGWETQALLVGPDDSGPLWALQRRGGDARLLVSNTTGETWQSFADEPWMRGGCLYDVTLDSSAADRLYASTCEGLYRWDGAWEQVSSEELATIAVGHGEPLSLWAITPGENGRVIHSADGGITWTDAGLTLPGTPTSSGIAMDIAAPDEIYVLWGRIGGKYSLYRGSGRGQWDRLPLPEGDESDEAAIGGMAVDARRGDLYVAAAPTLNRTSEGYGIWRTTNPDAVDPGMVHWGPYRDPFAPNLDLLLLGSGHLQNQFTLYLWAKPGDSSS